MAAKDAIQKFQIEITNNCYEFAACAVENHTRMAIGLGMSVEELGKVLVKYFREQKLSIPVEF